MKPNPHDLSASRTKRGILERLAPHIEVGQLNLSLGDTNAILRDLLAAQTRVAEALEAILLHAFEVDVRAELEPEPAPGTDGKLPAIPERNDDLLEMEEVLATIEIMEEQGIPIPPELYAHLGIEPPSGAATNPEPITEEEGP